MFYVEDQADESLLVVCSKLERKYPMANDDDVDYMIDHALLSKEAPHVELFDVGDDEGSNYIRRDYVNEWVDDK